MDIERYAELVSDAVEEANRLSAVSNGQNSVVLVMSRVMRNEILAREGVNYTARTGDCVDEYCGYRVGIVNEIDDEEFIVPAMVGMDYYPGMQLDDVIVVDDENRLFRLECTDPVQFADMGLTVDFGSHTDVVATAAVDNTATISTAINTATIVLDDFADTVSNITWNAATTTNGWDWLPGGTYTTSGYFFRTEPDAADRAVEYSPPKRKARKKEEELSAGDTRLLDEFLSGFARNGA